MCKRICTAVPLFFITYWAAAQRVVDQQLIKPIQHAITTNYEINSLQLEAVKTQLISEGVKSKAKPNIGANALYSFIYNSGTLDIPTVTLPITGIELFKGSQTFNTKANLATAGITATQVIFSGLQITNGIKALEEKAKAQEYMAAASKETIAKEVVQSFDQLMLLQEVEKLIRDSKIRLDKENDYVMRAIANGLAIPYDRDRIKLAQLELEAKKMEMEGARSLLQQKLMQLTHMPYEEIVAIQYKLDSIVLLNHDVSIDNRAELKALAASGKAFDYVLKKERGAALPQIFAFGSVSYLNVFKSKLTVKDVGNLDDVHLKLDRLSLMPNVLVGLGIKFDIYAGGHLKHKVKEAQLDIDINNNKLLDTKEKLGLLLEKNKIEYGTAQSILAVNTQKVKIAQNNIEMAGKQFREGLISVTERLAAENDLFSASLSYYSQLLQQRKTALDLLHTTGNLLQIILQ